TRLRVHGACSSVPGVARNVPLRVFLLGLAVTVAGGIGGAAAQTPAPPAIAGNIHSVTYIEVLPPSRAGAIALLRSYSEATRKEDGNLRIEVITRIGQPHQLVVLEVWRDQKAFEAIKRRPTPCRHARRSRRSAVHRPTSACTSGCRWGRFSPVPAVTPSTGCRTSTSSRPARTMAWPP